MPDLSQITQIADTVLMPLFGGVALLSAKLTVGQAARKAERYFLVVLVFVSALTLRTVITCDEIWLVHTTTLGMLIVGALVVPNQATTITEATPHDAATV